MPKRSLSPHQKRVRFFTGFFLFIIIAMTAVVFWFANRGLSDH